MTTIGTIRAAEILKMTPRMVQRYLRSGGLVANRTKGGFARFDEDYIRGKAEDASWRVNERTSRGSSGAKVLLTRTGTTPGLDGRDDRVSTLATLTKRRSASAASSSKDRPSLEDMLA